MKAIAALIAALIRAIFGIVTYPFRMLGWEPRPRGADIASAALAQADEEDRQREPSPAPAPEPSPDGPLPLPPFHAPLGHLIKSHAARILRDPYALTQPLPQPLPTDVDRWLSRLDDEQMRRVVSCKIPAWMLQEHVLAGAEGTLHSLGYRIPQPSVRPAGHVADGKEGRGGKGGGPINLGEVLEQLGYSPAAGPRMR